MDKITYRRCWNEYTNDWDTVAIIKGCECNPGKVVSYMHIGQHGEADKTWVKSLPDCPPVDSVDLRAELISIGYELEVTQ